MFSSELAFQVIPQSDRIVVLTVVGTVNKRDSAPTCCLQDRIAHFGISLQFGFVTLPKFVPFLRIMAEPLAQLGSGCNIFQPRIEAKRGFLYATRPQSFYEKALTIFPRSRFVCAFQLEHRILPP